MQRQIAITGYVKSRETTGAKITLLRRTVVQHNSAMMTDEAGQPMNSVEFTSVLCRLVDA